MSVLRRIVSFSPYLRSAMVRFPLCQSFFLNARFSYFGFKSTHLAQVLENFAQTCVCMSATFKSSATGDQYISDKHAGFSTLGPGGFIIMCRTRFS